MAVINKTGLEGREDFLGFTFNGRHSSEFRIIRVIKNNRLDETLVSNPKDTTIDIPGNDGLYFIKSKLQQREISIDFAYDDLYDEDLYNLRQWLACDAPRELIFDEFSYKAYLGKIKGTPKLSFIAFEENGKRVYRGEGSMQFICYLPWAHSVEINSEEVVSEDKTLYTVKNLGQLDAPFTFVFQPKNKENYSYIQLTNTESNTSYYNTIVLDNNRLDIEKQYLFDSEKHLLLCIEKANYLNGKLTYDIVKDAKGNAVIANGAIIAGDFFKIPADSKEYNIKLTGLEAVNLSKEQERHFFYNYLYY